MKKIILIALVAVFMFSACSDESSMGVSKVTTYAVLKIKGNANLFWPLNTPFVDPGCTAFEGTTDISSKIVATSTVNATKGGKYSIVYKAQNSDGFSASVTRTVYVCDVNSPLNGYYESSISRTNTTTGAVGARGPFSILVFGIGGSNLWVEDLMGGWYYYGSAYGVGYAGTAVLKLASDNTLSVVSSYPTTFGAGSACVLNAVSTYNPATKTILLHSNMGDTGNLIFNVTLNNPSSLN
jgi:hypothetical protein